MRKLIFVFLFPLFNLFSDSIDDKIDRNDLMVFLRHKCRESYYLLKNSDDEIEKSFFKGKFLAYRETVEIIESLNSED